MLVAAAEEGTSLWALDDDSLVAAACRMANRNLTPAEWDKYLGAETAYARTCR
jgi:hypothetical protein